MNDLLFVARLQAGGLSLEPEDVDLAGVVRDGVKALAPRAAAKAISLTCVLDAVPAVHVDRGRMLQVLDNLVSNALKFTPEGGAVHVSLRQDDDCVRLEVTDSGIGIAPDDHGLTSLHSEAHVPGATLLVGFGPAADRLDPSDREAVARAVRALLPEAEVEAVGGHDWVADEYSRGAWPATLSWCFCKNPTSTRYLILRLAPAASRR